MAYYIYKKHMIKETVNEYRFMDAFRGSDTYKNNFSYHGLKALYEHLDQLSEDTGEDIELDVVAICCDYSEYDSALECATEYGYKDLDDENIADEDAQEADALEWLRDRTQVIEVEGHDYSKGITDAPIVRSVIIQSF
jgi:hypothetical protein